MTISNTFLRQIGVGIHNDFACPGSREEYLAHGVDIAAQIITNVNREAIVSGLPELKRFLIDWDTPTLVAIEHATLMSFAGDPDAEADLRAALEVVVTRLEEHLAV